MKRKKKDAAPAEPHPEDLTPAPGGEAGWDGPTRAGDEGEIADLAAESARLEHEAEVDGEVIASDDSATERVSLEEAGVDPAVLEREGVSDAVSIEIELGTEVPITDSASEEGASVEAAADEGVDRASADSSGEPVEADDEDAEPPVESPARLESIVESLLFASDKPLTVADLKKLVNEHDGKKLTAALEALKARHAETGIHLASLAGGWQFRTNPLNAAWVSKLIAGKPQRLSRAMLETMAIVAYRQPITRPEIDEIRGVDCGAVLKTLLDRGLVRILGKKEDVGRPMLYGTTPEFLKTFSLKDLSELPTLREFHELSEQQMAIVDAKAPPAEGVAAGPPPDAPRSPFAPTPADLAPVDQSEEDALLEELETATEAAARAQGPPPGQAQPGAEPSESQS